MSYLDMAIEALRSAETQKARPLTCAKSEISAESSQERDFDLAELQAEREAIAWEGCLRWTTKAEAPR
jgi:hypothetical protein